MDEVAGAVGLAEVAVLLEAILVADGGVDQLEVEMLLHKRIELPEILDQSVAVPVISIGMGILACSQNFTSAFSVLRL